MLDYRRLFFFGCSSNQTHRHRALLSSLRSSVLIILPLFWHLSQWNNNCWWRRPFCPWLNLVPLLLWYVTRLTGRTTPPPLGRFRGVCSPSGKMVLNTQFIIIYGLHAKESEKTLNKSKSLTLLCKIWLLSSEMTKNRQKKRITESRFTQFFV